ncbi:hypothetical protein ALMP_37640 [Streptomyces sp. A012304]|nr:hypothetical protein ALMP_37640 [Streptomyces sp. A012304]
MQPVILDTDVASLSHRRKLAGPLATRLIGRKPLITFVTFSELDKWTEIRHGGTRSRQELADWLSGIPILPGDEAVAATGAACRPRASSADDRARSTTCLIAACALRRGAKLPAPSERRTRHALASHCQTGGRTNLAARRPRATSEALLRGAARLQPCRMARSTTTATS